jgi:ribosomal protein S18
LDTSVSVARFASSKNTNLGGIEEELAELEAQIERSSKAQQDAERSQRAGSSKRTAAPVSAFEDISDLDEDLTALPAKTPVAPKATNKNAWKQPRFSALSASGADSAKVQEREDKIDGNDVLSLEDDTDRINAGKKEEASSAETEIDADLRQRILSEVEDDLRSVAATLSSADIRNASQRTTPDYNTFVSDLQQRARPFQSESSMAALGATEEDDLVDDSASGTKLPPQGLTVDYCIFCHHGTHFLRHDNVALLTKFVSDKGLLLPKRFTQCCPKHQRKYVASAPVARSCREPSQAIVCAGWLPPLSDRGG